MYFQKFSTIFYFFSFINVLIYILKYILSSSLNTNTQPYNKHKYFLKSVISFDKENIFLFKSKFKTVKKSKNNAFFYEHITRKGTYKFFILKISQFTHIKYEIWNFHMHSDNGEKFFSNIRKKV